MKFRSVTEQEVKHFREFGWVHLPFVLPHDVMLYAVLRKAYTRLQAGRGIGSFGSYDTTQTVPKERHDF